MTIVRRPAISDLTPEDNLSYRNELTAPHFIGEHLLEDYAFMMTGETDEHDIVAVSLIFNVDGSTWGGKPVTLRQTNFLAIPKTQRGKGMADNDYIGVRADPVRPQSLEVTRDGDTVVWKSGNMVATADVPYWTLAGDHAGVEFDITMGGLCEASKFLGEFADLQTNGRAGIEQPLWVEGNISSGGQSFDLQRGIGMLEKVIIGEGWVQGEASKRVTKHNWMWCLDENVRIFTYVKEATGVSFGHHTIGEEHGFYAQDQIEIVELDYWVDPRTGVRLPCKFSVTMKSDDSTVALIVEAYGRFMYTYCQAEANISYYGLLCRAHGSVMTKDGLIRIDDMRTYMECGIYPTPIPPN